MQDNKNRTGIYITKEINNLKINDGLKILLAVIAYYEQNEDGFFAGDKHLRNLLGKSIPTIQKRLIELENLGLIKRAKIYSEAKRPKRGITTTLLNNEYHDTQKRVFPLLENEYHNKDTNKELNNRESALAFEFLKINYPKRFKKWENKYKPEIPNYAKFIEDYNDTVEMKSIKYEPDSLFYFLIKYATGFIKNKNKYN